MAAKMQPAECEWQSLWDYLGFVKQTKKDKQTVKVPKDRPEIFNPEVPLNPHSTVF